MIDLLIFFQTCISLIQLDDEMLKGPSQLPPFSMALKLFKLLDEAKSYYFSASCVPEGMFNYLY